jgi:dipeptidyl aminopeptidase/acylaminoacyl peptidase
MREPSGRVLLPGALFALKYVHDARLSPDGRCVVYVTSRTVEETAEEFFELTVLELASGVRRDLEFSGRATFPQWSPDGTRLAFVGAVGNSHRLYVCAANGDSLRALTPNDSQVQGPINWSPDGSSIAYTVVTHRKREGIRRITTRDFKSEGLGIIDELMLNICAVEVERGAIRSFDVGPITAMQPAFSPCGKRILFMGSDAALGYPSLSFSRLKLFTIELAGGEVSQVLGDGWFIAAFAWSPCGERVVVAGDYESTLGLPTPRLWVVNRDGSGRQCRTDGFIGNIGSRVHHDMPTWATSQNNFFIVPDTRWAYATVLVGGCTEIWRIDLEGPNHRESVVSGERTCVIMDVSTKTSQLLFCASDLHRPWELHELDLVKGQEKQLTHLNDDVLAGWPALKVEHLRFQSEDGLPLEGWYLARADREGPQPTVMFIHGGPMLATGHAFRFDFHLLAANGFAVLFANFRGSSGYGEPFNRAILGDWGARAFPDHMAAVDAAIARGLADANRLGVWGPSHGGFATAWIVGHTHRFRAAVAESAAINFSTMYYLSDAADLFAYDLGGRPDEIPDVYRSRSPLTYAARCRTPTLLVHGEEDMRCPIVEAEQFYRVLHDVGCKTELVRIPGMTHVGDSIGPLSARWAQNEALLDWFERHL